jgi:hypothetical protein
MLGPLTILIIEQCWFIWPNKSMCKILKLLMLTNNLMWRFETELDKTIKHHVGGGCCLVIGW